MPTICKPTFIIGDDQEGITLPDSLFISNNNFSNSISPAACFDPLTSSNGNAWQSSTAPSMQPKKKILIFDKAFAPNSLNLEQNIAVAMRLKNAGFRIFVKAKYMRFVELGETDIIEDMRNFDPNNDYKVLAKSGFARQELLLLSEVKKDLFSLLHTPENDEILSIFFSFPNEQLDAIKNDLGENPKSKFFRILALFKILPGEKFPQLLESFSVNEMILGAAPKKLPKSLTSFPLGNLTLDNKTQRRIDTFEQVEIINLLIEVAKILEKEDSHKFQRNIEEIYSQIAAVPTIAENFDVVINVPQEYSHFFHPTFTQPQNLNFYSTKKLTSLPIAYQKKLTDLIVSDASFDECNLLQLNLFLNLMPQKEAVILPIISTFLADKYKHGLGLNDLNNINLTSYHFEFLLEEALKRGQELQILQESLIECLFENSQDDEARFKTLFHKFILPNSNLLEIFFNDKLDCITNPNCLRYALGHYPKNIEISLDSLKHIIELLPEAEIKPLLDGPRVGKEKVRDLILKHSDIYELASYHDKFDIDTGCILGNNVTQKIKNRSIFLLPLLELHPEKFHQIKNKYAPNLTLTSSPFSSEKSSLYQEDYGPFDQSLKDFLKFQKDGSFSERFDPKHTPNSRILPKKSQTLLNLSHLDPQALEDMARTPELFANIVCARVMECDDGKLLDGLIPLLPKLQHLILPENLQEGLDHKTVLENNIALKYSPDYRNSLKMSEERKLTELIEYDSDSDSEEMSVDDTNSQNFNHEEDGLPNDEEIADQLIGQGSIEVQSILGDYQVTHLNQLAPEFDRLYDTTPINDVEQLNKNTLTSPQKKILLITNQVEEHANHLLRTATTTGKKIYYIDSPAKIDFDKDNIYIDNSGQPKIEQKSFLQDFLAEGDPLLINWTNFSQQQKLALNTMLDKKRSIAGHQIPENICIISLTNTIPKDPSFLSRHESTLQSYTRIPSDLPQINEQATTQKIDLLGMPNWRREIFGPILLVNNIMEWRKSPFVEALESGTTNFEILNISEEEVKKLNYEVNQAKALGYFDYQGYKINISPDFNLKINQQESLKLASLAGDFSAVSNATYDQSTPNSHVINSFIFDFLLHDKEVENGYYSETKGLIDLAASNNQPLKLFISDNLTQAQWYCLFRKAQDKEVKLELFLAPNVKLPAEITTQPIFLKEPTPALEERPRLIITNNVTAIKNTSSKVFDIEDSSYQDLFSHIDFTTTPTGFKDFKKINSQILDTIENNSPHSPSLTLRGKFSTDLLAFLHPHLVKDYPKLTVIVEDNSLQPNQTQVPQFSWLEHEVIFNAPSIKQEPTIYREEINNQDSASEFIGKRKNIFTNVLFGNRLLQLVGHSGAGKSSLIKEFEKDPNSPFKIFREFENLNSWAEDKSDKVKILFIDESNIEDQHFATFAPLKTGGNCITYKGQIFNLTPQHKVVFASNEKSYGGGRVEQKLFADNSIPQIHLGDFSPNYIYENILKAAIYDQLSPEVKEKVQEEDFFEKCQEKIKDYQDHNAATASVTNNLTVRELQEQVLEYVALTFKNRVYEEIISPNFISTNATKEAEEKLQQILDTRNLQRSGHFPSSAVGVNGILLEGDSGSGKSVLIEAMLARNNIAEATNDATPAAYYKIDASQTLAQKKKILIKAFEEGNIVWIDELNSCIDDGLEKILNAVLTGEHPDGKKTPVKPGFTLLASVNQISLEGRSALSPALLHRMEHVKTPPLNEYLTEDLAKIIGHWIGEEENEKAPAIAHDFKELLQKNSTQGYNLRTLHKIAHDPEFLENYDPFLVSNDNAYYVQRQLLPPQKNFKEKFSEIESFIDSRGANFEANYKPDFLSHNFTAHYTLNTDRCLNGKWNEESYEKLKKQILEKTGYENFFQFSKDPDEEENLTLHILVPAKILNDLDPEILKPLTKIFPQLTKPEQIDNNYTIYGLRSQERMEFEKTALQEMQYQANTEVSFTKDELQQELFFRQPNITKPIPPITNFSQLQEHSFCIGEFHDHKSSKRILMDNLGSLQEQGFRTIFLEGLIYDSVTQDLLNEYFKQGHSSEISPPLKEILKSCDENHQNHEFGYCELVIAAKENGIKCVGIESNYSTTVPKNISPEDNKTKRCKDMNYAAKFIIEKEAGGAKWAAIVGNAHLRTIKNATGLTELMGVPALYVYDSKKKHEVETIFGKARANGIESDVRIACPENISLNFGNITNIHETPKTRVTPKSLGSQRLEREEEDKKARHIY